MRNITLLKAGAAPLAIGLALAATPAFAQDTETSSQTTTQSDDVGVGPVEAADTDNAGSIVVTGSRIRQPNLESASPVTVVTAQEFAETGTTRVEDLVNSLPQVFAGQGSNISNGSTGTADGQHIGVVVKRLQALQPVRGGHRVVIEDGDDAGRRRRGP